jgi:hypothetical protein
MGEPRRLDRVAEERAGGAPPVERAEPPAGARRPLAVVPGAQHERVLAARVAALERLVRDERAEHVLLVPAPADDERRYAAVAGRLTWAGTARARQNAS